MKCQQRIWRGPRSGQVCGRNAAMFAVIDGTFVCGIHARAWRREALVRLARWDRRERAWV